MTDTRYALLNPGDVIQEGDEYFVDGGWEIVSGSIGNTKANEWPFRRALPAADTSALGAVVKPLVWHTYDVWTHWAESTSGTYRVQERNGVWRTSLLLPQTEHIVYEYDADDTTPADFEAARAAAQADHEARILAALEPPTHAAQLAAALALPEVAAMRTAGANWCAVWANRDYNDPSFPARHDRAYLDLIHALAALEARHDHE